jgi:2'-5' RNA ligase
MRLFIGIDLPPDVAGALAAVRSELGGDDAVRWVRAESMHLTLRFLGETPDDRIEPLDRTLQGIRRETFGVRVSGLGFFPNGWAPRVFWAGIRSGGLTRLADEVERRVTLVGFDRNRRAFNPHLTLARSRGDARIDRSFVERAGAFQDREFGRFVAARFFLYRSRPGPSGAVHDRLKEYPLGE